MAQALAVNWREMQPEVKAERAPQRQARPGRRGCPREPVVSGYLMGNDSTMSTPKGRNMEDMGTHRSTTHQQRTIGHYVVHCLSVLLPLPLQVSRQEKMCDTFQSIIALMERSMRIGESVAGTKPHVVLERWFYATCVWRTVHERDVLITAGLKSNRWLRMVDEMMPQGWRWQMVRNVSAENVRQVSWLRGGSTVSIHVVSTNVGTRSCFQCQSLSVPLSQARFQASNDLDVEAEMLLAPLSARRNIEALFADGKEEVSLDHSQGMSAHALVRFWTLAMLISVFLEQKQQRVCIAWQGPVTSGEARRNIQRRHRHQVRVWLHQRFP